MSGEAAKVLLCEHMYRWFKSGYMEHPYGVCVKCGMHWWDAVVPDGEHIVDLEG
jgi:hypothetical protein